MTDTWRFVSICIYIFVSIYFIWRGFAKEESRILMVLCWSQQLTGWSSFPVCKQTFKESTDVSLTTTFLPNAMSLYQTDKPTWSNVIQRAFVASTGLWAIKVWPVNWCWHWRAEIGARVRQCKTDKWLRYWKSTDLARHLIVSILPWPPWACCGGIHVASRQNPLQKMVIPIVFSPQFGRLEGVPVAKRDCEGEIYTGLLPDIDFRALFKPLTSTSRDTSWLDGVHFGVWST